MKVISNFCYRSVLRVAILLFAVIGDGKGKLIWIDNFDGPAGSLPSSKNWKFDVGTSYPGGPPTWGTGEIQTYTNDPKNVALDGSGNLRITPLRDASGKWTSSRIETQRDDFKPPSGGILTIEARIQLPDVTGDAALGYWPAFWALGAPLRQNYYSWPKIGEYDILENVNGENRVWATLHCDVNPGGVCHETAGLGYNIRCPGQPCQTAFHTFKFDWDDGKKEYRWYVDNQQFHKVIKANLTDAVWNDLNSHGYFILLNVAMGGGFPNGRARKTTPTAATVPGKPMIIDYVAVYSQ